MAKTAKKPATPREKPKERPPKAAGAYDAAVDGTARATIIATLRSTEGNRTKAARALGLTLRRLYREIDRLGLADQLESLARELNWPPNPGSQARWGQS